MDGNGLNGHFLPDTEHPFTARKDASLGGADAPNRIVRAVKWQRP